MVGGASVNAHETVGTGRTDRRVRTLRATCALLCVCLAGQRAAALTEALTVEDIYGMQHNRVRGITSLQFSAERVWIRHRLPSETPPLDVALMQFAPLPQEPRARVRYRMKGIRVSAEEVAHGPFGVPSKRTRFTFTGSTFSVVSLENGHRSRLTLFPEKGVQDTGASTVTEPPPVPPTAEPYRFAFHSDSGPWVYDRLRQEATWSELASRSRLIGRSEVNGRSCVVVEIADDEGIGPPSDATAPAVAVTRVYFDPLLGYFPVKYERHGFVENGGSIEYRVQDVLRMTDGEGTVLYVPERAVREYWLQEGPEFRLGHSVSWVVDPDSVRFNERGPSAAPPAASQESPAPDSDAGEER